MFQFLDSAGRAEPFKFKLARSWSEFLSDSYQTLVRLQKPPTAAALPADPAPKLPGLSPLAAPSRQFSNFWQTFRRSKIHRKSDSSKSIPKYQKSDP